MATPSIGGAQFDFLWGTVGLLQDALQDISRPGEDGTGIRLLGTRAEPSELRTMKGYATALAAEAAHGAHMAAVAGALVTVTLANADAIPNVQVIRVLKARPVKQALGRVGGSGDFQLWETWIVQQTTGA